jgi:hypothetical protein
VALVLGAYVLTVVALFRTVQLRVWNYFGIVDLMVMTSLILPFMTSRLFGRFRPTLGVSRSAWIICAVMALDVLFFTLGVFGPFSTGHPSLEALGSYYLGLAKLVLIPAALLLLVLAGVKGERMVVVAIGFLCLLAETLYATYPMAG